MRGVRLGDEASGVEHQRIIRPGGVGLDLGEDRVNQVAVVDLRVEHVGPRAPDRAGDERDPAEVVDRRLELGQDDQGRPARVDPRVHPRRVLDPSGER